MRGTRVIAYRLPDESFERWDRFWISRDVVEPVDVVDLGDLVDRHAVAGIDLRIEDDLLSRWQQVIASTLDFSGIRLRNATMAT
ncbi:MAG: DUF6886 family protein [Gaiellaceae bacterium]